MLELSVCFGTPSRYRRINLHHRIPAAMELPTFIMANLPAGKHACRPEDLLNCQPFVSGIQTALCA